MGNDYVAKVLYYSVDNDHVDIVMPFNSMGSDRVTKAPCHGVDNDHVQLHRFLIKG